MVTYTTGSEEDADGPADAAAEVAPVGAADAGGDAGAGGAAGAEYVAAVAAEVVFALVLGSAGCVLEQSGPSPPWRLTTALETTAACVANTVAAKKVLFIFFTISFTTEIEY